MKTVKIGDTEYRQIKAIAKKRGYFLQFLLNEAVRSYLAMEAEQAKLDANNAARQQILENVYGGDKPRQERSKP